MDLKTKVVGSALLCVAFSSAALTLGRMRGAAWVGQTLNVAIPVEFEAEESQTPPCVAAEVFHADTKLEPNRVRVTVQASPQSQGALVQVATSVPVDEPVVTVYLHAGCTSKTSRRYVLLAELPEEIVMSVAVPVVPVPPAMAEPAKPPGPAVSGTATPAVPRATAPIIEAVPHQPAPKKPVAAAVPRPDAASTAATPAAPVKAADATKRKQQPDEPRIADRVAGGGGGRLRLDPLELLTERVAQLESAAQAAPSANALRDAQRLQKFEADVQALLALAVKNERGMLELRERLQKAEAERYDNPLVYGLALLLLACLVAVVYLWRRQGGATPGGRDWWRGSTRVEDEAESSRFEGTHAATIQPDSSKSAAAEQVDLNLEELIPDARPAPSKASMPAAGGAPPAVMPRGEVARDGSANVIDASPAARFGALFDVRQQAEFFLSLGQTDQAIRVLKDRIREGGVDSPLMYLDLLKIFHLLGMKEAYGHCREEFKHLFKGRVPDYADFGDEGRHLETYPQVLAPISLLWPSPEVLPVIESFIFRDPADGLDDDLDLAAFRDLVLLHAVAGSVVDEFLAGGVGARPADQPALEWESPVVSAMAGQADRRNPAAAMQSVGADVQTPAVDLDLFEPAPLPVEQERALPMLDFDLPEIDDRSDATTNQAAPGRSS